MKLPVLWSGLCCYTEGWGGKCSEILATIKLLYSPRVNKVFTHSLSDTHIVCHFCCLNRTVSGDIRLTTRYNSQGSKLEVIVHQARLVKEENILYQKTWGTSGYGASHIKFIIICLTFHKMKVWESMFFMVITGTFWLVTQMVSLIHMYELICSLTSPVVAADELMSRKTLWNLFGMTRKIELFISVVETLIPEEHSF